HAGLPKTHHSFVIGTALQLRRFGAMMDQVSQLIRSAQEFVQGDAAFEASLGAGFTPPPARELKGLAIAHSERLPRVFTVAHRQSIVLLRCWLVRFFTIDADPLAESLGEHP